MGAHEHYYARTFALYNHSSFTSYVDAQAPIHIITGSAGNRQHHSTFSPNLKSWVAHHQLDYGYTRLVFRYTHHIQLQQVSDDRDGAVIDQIDIVKHADKPAWLR